MSKNCKNCGQETKENFCSNCGQSTHTNRVDLHHLIHEFLHGVLHVDKGIFFTIKELTIRPGKTIRNYLDGKRVNYFKPFGYLFILATIYTLIMHFLDTPIVEAYLDVSINDTPEDLSKVVQFTRLMLDWVNDHYAIVSLVMLPLSALASRIIFCKAKYNYGEHLVINSYIHGQTILLLILFGFAVYFPLKHNMFIYISFWASSLLKIYMYFCIFDKYKTISKILLSIITLLLELILITIVISIIAFIIVITFLDFNTSN